MIMVVEVVRMMCLFLHYFGFIGVRLFISSVFVHVGNFRLDFSF